jgi:AraC-like DNA-binding protein
LHVCGIARVARAEAGHLLHPLPDLHLVRQRSDVERARLYGPTPIARNAAGGDAATAAAIEDPHPDAKGAPKANVLRSGMRSKPVVTVPNETPFEPWDLPKSGAKASKTGGNRPARVARSRQSAKMAGRILMQAAGRMRPVGFDAAAAAPPLVNSAATSWAGLPFETHRVQSFERKGEAGPVGKDCGLLVILDGQVQITTRGPSGEVRLRAPAGATFLLSGESRPNDTAMTGSAEVVVLPLPVEWFQRLSLEGAPPAFATTQVLPRDEILQSLVRAMRDDVVQGAVSGRLFAESVSIALLSRIIRGVPACRQRLRGRLSDSECQRLRSHVLDRLGEDLSLEELAAQVGCSVRHFSTLFRRAFGTSPHRYVLTQRLAEGARLLARGEGDIAGIAFRLGFSSQSHFAIAFRRAHGVAPRRFAFEKRTPG